MSANEKANHFEQSRTRLLGLSYRILGSVADAEDAVQDTYLKWARQDPNKIDNSEAWLTRVCTRHCLDIMKSSHKSRVDYIGTWLPEPIQTSTNCEFSDNTELACSLTTAFLLMLERLTPKERAAYLLREIFETSYEQIAETLNLQEANCRKLVSRAKLNIDKDKVRNTTPFTVQDQFLNAFQSAITDGNTEPLAHLLSDDIRLDADGGGKVATIKKSLNGKAAVMEFLGRNLHQYWANHDWQSLDINGSRGIVISLENVTTAIVSFSFDSRQRVTGIYIMRNPEKMNLLSKAPIH
ncbi:RNA polymerase sigma factor SigJ [Aestuariirhabdus haliotis]|uniref:RNA polymerase sigma factor SigJ n=1 Tax=Aestuariirhabdus haliotis TaxID=2918751 RepID=UPI0020C05FB2|nr:RNA polymerase sigma factor SigJ [Aestuariirhabdus haliotis]MCL6421216.1 RNA polymerase sigma factor SigJ [Aestuariirhabdus haliotis]